MDLTGTVVVSLVFSSRSKLDLSRNVSFSSARRDLNS